MDETNEITREWQDEIRGLFLKEGIDVDGGGCESGDPFDFTKSEVAQGICKFVDRLDEKTARIKQLEAALREILALHPVMATRVLDVVAIARKALEPK